MTTKSEALAELDAEFGSEENMRTGAMKLDAYMRRQREILAQPDPPPAPPREVEAPAPSKRFFSGIAQAIIHGVKLRADPLAARCAALEARIAALEARKSISYAGIWREGEQHTPGDIVTHGGTLWYCHGVTAERPGTTDAWQLMAKSK